MPAHPHRKSLRVCFELPEGDPANPVDLRKQLEHLLHAAEFTKLLQRSVVQQTHILAGPDSRQCSAKVSCSVNTSGAGQCTVEVSCSF